MTVKFEKDGLFEYKWNGKLRKDVRRRVKKLAVWKHLRDACEIEEGVTLLDIFRTVNKYKMLKLFLSQYSWCWELQAFHDSAEEPDYTAADDDPNGDHESNLSYLEVYWHSDFSEADDEDPQCFDLSPSFHAIGPPPKNDKMYEGHTEDIAWGISFSTMSSLAHLPVKLNKKAEFYSTKNWKPGTPPVFQGERTFNLLDVLDAIYWEISFHGGPQKKTEVKDMLQGMVEDIKSGLVKGVPAEQVFPELGENPNPDGMKIVLHPNLAKQLGVDPDTLEDQNVTD